jgi:hypothetical protein
MTFDVTANGRRWHVWPSVTGRLWYAGLRRSSPPVVLRGKTKAAVLAELKTWAGRLSPIGVWR